MGGVPAPGARLEGPRSRPTWRRSTPKRPPRRRWRDSLNALPRRPRPLPERRTCGTHLQSPPLTKEHRRARLLPGWPSPRPPGRRDRRVQRVDDDVARDRRPRGSSCRPASPTSTAVVDAPSRGDMTIERWRRLRRSTAPTQRDPWSRLVAAARRVGRHGERRCDHLHDTVSRYDHATNGSSCC
jgi:hypothetical protein